MEELQAELVKVNTLEGELSEAKKDVALYQELNDKKQDFAQMCADSCMDAEKKLKEKDEEIVALKKQIQK